MKETVFMVGVDLPLLRELVGAACVAEFVQEEPWQDDATGSSGTDAVMRPCRLERAALTGELVLVPNS